MNELKSYTEYAVSTPTADFVIGFDFNYGEDAVNVTVDDVPASVAGYTVVYLNETTIQLSPSVSSGVVRLQRETDIDQSEHAYRAGAKFIAQTMDENFEQLRHSQQEVRDGFSKLSDDTYEIIDTLQVVGQAAQDAADAAEQAAQTANDAAAQVNDKVSYQDLDNAVELAVAPVRDYTALPYEVGKLYDLNSRVMLGNGDIVKSTVAGNTLDPNVDMTGWVNFEGEQLEINANRTYTLDDFAGSNDSEKLLNAFTFFADRGGRLILNPREHIFTSLVESSITKKIDIYAVGAVIKTSLSTLVIDMKNTSFSWTGGEFNAVGKAKVATNIFVNSSGADSVSLSEISFDTVNFGFNLDNVKTFNQTKCKGKGARYWNVFLKSFESAVIDGNDMRNNEYDGIKVGSDDTSGPQLYAKKLIITNNTGGGNLRDLIDFAVNNCELVVVANNISDDDVLRCVDAKIVYQSTTGLKNLIIAGNTGKRTSATEDQTFINVQGLGGVATVSKGLVVNNIAECTGASISPLIRIADAVGIKVSNNDSDGFYYFVRLTGGANNNIIKNNTANKCVHFAQSQALSGRIPTANKIIYNEAICLGHASGVASSFARLDGAGDTEIHNNEYVVTSTAYPITHEANGTSATNTKIGKNYRGFSASAPTGFRAVVNDTWRSSGDVTEYVCNTQTASTTLAQLTRVSNKSIETGGVTQTTNASGIISINHSLGKIPLSVIVSVAGDNQYTVKDVGKTATAVSFKVFNGGAALASTEVSLSYYLTA